MASQFNLVLGIFGDLKEIIFAVAYAEVFYCIHQRAIYLERGKKKLCTKPSGHPDSLSSTEMELYEAWILKIYPRYRFIFKKFLIKSRVSNVLN